MILDNKVMYGRSILEDAFNLWVRTTSGSTVLSTLHLRRMRRPGAESNRSAIPLTSMLCENIYEIRNTTSNEASWMHRYPGRLRSNWSRGCASTRLAPP